MKIYLSAEWKIKDVKKRFEKSFPYLKLEFFRKKHAPGKGNLKRDIVPGSATLIEISGVMKEGEIEINPRQTVADIEQQFQKGFNLPVQVFRKTKFSWIETIRTDKLTLEKQNLMGRQDCGSVFNREILL
ncbi:MAG TPA: hypothetical protein VIQ00_12845 [Chitinophagaceae bacterium]|jgi:hypothetical protein